MAKTLTELIDFLDAQEAPPPLSAMTEALAELEVDWSALGAACALLLRGPIAAILSRPGRTTICWSCAGRTASVRRSTITPVRTSPCGVLRGTMTETLFEFAPNGHVKPTCSRDVPVGAMVASVDKDMHQVSNLQADDADLITLHLYSPPLLVMGTYSLHDRERGEELMYLAFSDAAGI